MADIKLSIINQAISAAGEEPLTVLAAGSVMANAAIENYDSFVEEELENGTWKFASKTADLSLLTARADEPLQYQWQIPSDCLVVISVLYNGRDLDGEYYQIEGRKVRTQYDADVTIKYVYRPDESEWPKRFQRIVSQRLEALFLRVTERHSEAARRDEDTSIKTMIARHTEARQQRNRPLGDGTLVQARFGSRRRRSS